MTAKTIPIVLISALFLLVPHLVLGAGFYLGGGIATTAFSGDLKRGLYFDIKPFLGTAVNGGFRFMGDRLALDVTGFQGTGKDEFSGSDAKFTWFEAGPRYSWILPEGYQPFVLAGAGTYRLELVGNEYEGQGGFAGFGIEDFSGPHSMKFTVKGSYWKGDLASLDAPSLSISLIYTFNFGR